MSKDIPVSLPEYDPINEEQVALQKRFVAEHLSGNNLADRFKNATEGEKNFVAYKFLCARGWVYDDAVTMLKDVEKLRKELKLDDPETKKFPTPYCIRGFDEEQLRKIEKQEGDRKTEVYDSVAQIIQKEIPQCLHKVDKTGHPLQIQLVGCVNARRLTRRAKAALPLGRSYLEVFAQHRVHVCEVMGTVVRAAHINNSKKLGRDVTTITAIMDLTGFGFGSMTSELFELFGNNVDYEKRLYPEGLHRLFVVNCPKMVQFAYNLVKGAIDKRVRDKIVFVSPENTREVLLKVVDAENLPKVLGGTCECLGGCFGFDLREFDELDKHDVSGKPEEMITKDLAAGKACIHEIAATKGERVIWAFEVDGGKDIFFSAKFYKNKKEAQPTRVDAAKNLKQIIDESGAVVFERSKMTMHCGDYVVPESGVVRFVWDNGDSWMKGKQVSFCVEKEVINESIKAS